MISGFTWTPYGRRRIGYSCDRDAPHLSPCRRAHCSACTQQLREKLGPQIQRELEAGYWAVFSLLYEAHRYSDDELPSRRLEFLKDVLRRKIKGVGLDDVRIIAAFDVMRADDIFERKKLDHSWLVHVHGFIEVSMGEGYVQQQLEIAFPATPNIPVPVEIKPITNPAGWIAYFLKDPRDMYKRPYYRWARKPKPVRDDRSARREYPKIVKRKLAKPRRWRLTEREAEPLMTFLSNNLVADRLFLQKFRLSKDHGQIVAINTTDKPTPSENHREITPTTSVRTRIASKQLQTRPVVDSDGYTRYLAFLELRQRLRSLTLNLKRRYKPVGRGTPPKRNKG